MAATLALGAAIAASAQVNVTFNFVAGRLYDSNSVLLGDGALVLFVADTGDNGFGTLTAGGPLDVGSFLNGDVQILAHATVNSANGIGTASGGTSQITLGSGTYSQLSVNDPLAVLWFPTLTSSSFAITAGTSYGFFRDTNWLVPSSSGLYDFNFLTPAASGLDPTPYTESQGIATFTAIPEPSTYATFAGVAMLGLALWRRRHAARST